MAEAFGVAASALSLVGLTGQIIQGCQHVRDIVDDIKDAARDIQHLRKELALFQLTLEMLERPLTNITGLDDKTDQHLRQVLALSNEAVDGLVQLVKKHKPGSIWWSNVKFVNKSTRFAKHLSKMERAKGYILIAQTNLNLRQLHQDHLVESLVAANSALMVQHQATTISENANTSLPDLENRVTESSSIESHVNDLDRAVVLPSNFSRQRLTEPDFQANRTPRQQVIYCQMIERTLSELLGIKHIFFLKKTRQKSRSMIGNEDTSSITTTYSSTTLIFNLWLWHIAIILSKIDHAMIRQCSFNIKIRVHNVVKDDAPIIQACRTGDLDTAKRLFASGQASPFDQTSGEVCNSLLEIACWELSSSWRFGGVSENHDAYAYYKLIEYLIMAGLDPGEAGFYRYGHSFLGLLEHDSRHCDPQFLSLIIDIGRVVLSQSQADPFFEIRNKGIEGQQAIQWHKKYDNNGFPFGKLLTDQEDWLIDWPSETNLKPPASHSASVYSILSDPSALTIREALKHVENGVQKSSEWAAISLSAFYQFKSRGRWIIPNDGNFCQAMKAHMLAFFEYGMDPRFQISCGEECRVPLATLFRTAGFIPLLQDVLRINYWTDDDIKDLSEEELYCSLAYQLSTLHIPYDHIEELLRYNNCYTSLHYIAICDLAWASYLDSYIRTEEFDGNDNLFPSPRVCRTSFRLRHSFWFIC